MKIEQTSDLIPHLPSLKDMLIRTVAEGASIGFHPPLQDEAAETFWLNVQQNINRGDNMVLLAYAGNNVIGTVQLAFANKSNAPHRAEVQKLMVHPDARGIGVGRNLMVALERVALEQGRTLLILDTIEGDIAEGLYERLGYTRVGVVPGYTVEADGSRGATVIFYKHLDSET